MGYPPLWRRRLLVDFGPTGDVVQIGYEVWADGELLATGCREVGPFDDFEEITKWLDVRSGVQLRFPL